MDNLRLVELAQNKLLILYIINASKMPLSDDELTSFILENELLNFFYYKEYIANLIESELVYIDDEKKFHISNSGKESLLLFNDNISDDTKVFLNDKIQELNKEKISKKSVVSQYSESPFGNINVNLKIKESENTIFNLDIEVPTKDYAETICKNFKENPDEIYLEIVKLISKK